MKNRGVLLLLGELTGKGILRSAEKNPRAFFVRAPFLEAATKVQESWGRSPRATIHLQWFAKEGDEGRTEEPTEYKLKKAREEGKVVRSAELVSAIVLIVCIAALSLLAPWMLGEFLRMMRYFISIAASNYEVSNLKNVSHTTFFFFLKMSLPIMGLAALVAIVANIIQVGFFFTAKPITPDFKKISPKIGKWLKKSLFSVEALYNLGKSLTKVVVIAIIAGLNIASSLNELSGMTRLTVFMGLVRLSELSFFILIESASVMLVLSVPDYLFQRWQHRQSLMMTKQEIKEEFKQMEGDPLVRSRLKQRMRELLTTNMIRNVAKADVIITNPTHFAVALEWNRETMIAPMVTAKGQDKMALRIREVATENAIPLVENKPLARALYANVEIGDTVPEQYWEVVSKILAEIYRLNGKMALG